MPAPDPSAPVSPLRAARLEAGLLLRDVARDAQCAVSLVSMVERGYLAGTSARARIANAVGASLGLYWPVNS